MFLVVVIAKTTTTGVTVAGQNQPGNKKNPYFSEFVTEDDIRRYKWQAPSRDMRPDSVIRATQAANKGRGKGDGKKGDGKKGGKKGRSRSASRFSHGAWDDGDTPYAAPRATSSKAHSRPASRRRNQPAWRNQQPGGGEPSSSSWQPRQPDYAPTSPAGWGPRQPDAPPPQLNSADWADWQGPSFLPTSPSAPATTAKSSPTARISPRLPNLGTAAGPPTLRPTRSVPAVELAGTPMPNLGISPAMADISADAPNSARSAPYSARSLRGPAGEALPPHRGDPYPREPRGVTPPRPVAPPLPRPLANLRGIGTYADPKSGGAPRDAPTVPKTGARSRSRWNHRGGRADNPGPHPPQGPPPRPNPDDETDYASRGWS